MKREYDRDSKILIIDDEKILLKFYKIHLNRFFSKVNVVETPIKALNFAKKEKFDVVLSDIKMPKMNGLDLMSHYKKLYPETVFLLASAHLQTAEDQKIIDDLADGFLAKPFEMEELQSVLFSAIDLAKSRSVLQNKKAS